MAGAKSVGHADGAGSSTAATTLPPCADADYAIHDLAELLTLPLFDDRAPAPVAAESLTPHDDANEDRY